MSLRTRLALSTGVAIGTGWVIWKFCRRKPKLLLDGLTFAEGPRWHAGRLYFSDFYTREVVSVNTDGQRETVAQVPDPETMPWMRDENEFEAGGPSGLGFAPDGSLLIVEMRGRRLLKLAPGSKEPTEFASFKQHTDWQANDMVVDEKGNAYIGNMGFNMKAWHHLPAEEKLPALEKMDYHTCLIRVTPDGKASPCTSKEIGFPNGSMITPDGKTLIVAETFENGLCAYPRLEDGSLGQKFQWAALPGIIIDGACLDAEGHVWIAVGAMLPENPVYSKQRTMASWMRTGSCSAFVRVQQGGVVKEVIPCSEGFNATACVLGGEDGQTLFMLEAKVAGHKEVEEMLNKGTLKSNSRIRTMTVGIGAARSATCEWYCAGYC